MQPPRFDHQLGAAHARHDRVRQHQIDGFASEYVEDFGGAPCFARVVSSARERLDDKLSNVLIILDDQDTLIAADRRLIRLRSFSTTVPSALGR